MTMHNHTHEQAPRSSNWLGRPSWSESRAGVLTLIFPTLGWLSSWLSSWA